MNFTAIKQYLLASSVLRIKCFHTQKFEIIIVTILDFILVKNPLYPPSISFSYSMKRGRKKKIQKKVHQRKKNLEYVCKNIDVYNEFIHSISLYK